MYIELKKYEDALNKFNSNNLSDELDAYLTKSGETTRFKELTIKGQLTSKEQKKLTEIIHNYYHNKWLYYNKIDRYDNYIALLFLLISCILILISEQLTSFLSEIFLIFGWIIIWEIGYDLFYNQIIRKRKTKVYKTLAKCPINFETK